MKVLHVIQRYPPAVGGSENWCRDLSQELASMGNSVKVLTMDILEEEEFWRDPPVDRCTMRLGKIDWDGPVLVRRYQRSLPIFSFYHLFLRIVLDQLAKVYFYGPHSIEMYGRILSEARSADVVHLHTVPYPHNFFGYVAARLAGKRVVMTPYFHPGHPFYERPSHYWLLRHSDAVIALSSHERDHLAAKGVPASKIIVTGTGIRLEDYVPRDLSEFRAGLLGRHGLTDRTRLIVFLGRKTEYKGLDLLIDAIGRLRPRHDLALLMVGPSLAWFDDLYAALSPDDKIRIIDLGLVPHQDKVNVLHLASVLVLPSSFESFGIVFLEAWACGTPVIGTDTGAIPSVIDRGGLVFRPGDAADLAGKIEAVIADEHLGAVLADRGRDQILARYRWPRIAAAVRRIYRRSAEPRLRVLVCSNLWPPYVIGGAELAAHAQARALAELGHEIRVFAGRISPDGRPHDTSTERRDFLTTWVNLSRRDLSSELWDPDVAKIRDAFAQVLAEFEPDLVHMHNMVGLAATAADECRARGVPTVMTLHDFWGICFKNTMVKNDGAICGRAALDCLDCRETLTMGTRTVSVVERNARVLRSLRKIDRFIAPSQYLAERYAANGIEPDAITVLGYGIDITRFRPERDPGGPLTLGFLGYLGLHKGLQHLLRALADGTGLDDVRLEIIGDGDGQLGMQALARDLGLGTRATFRGRVPNGEISAIYQRIDILVVPSIWPENSPITIWEAMAGGLPVIASNVGGIPELVEDGVTGILVPPGDPQALASAIVSLNEAPERRREMGRRARARIEQLDLRGQVDRLVEIYRDVMDVGAVKPFRDEVIVLYDSPSPGSRIEIELLRQLTGIADRTKQRLSPWPLHASDDDAIAAARVAIIPIESARGLEHGVRAWLSGIPLLVSEQCPELTAICRASNGGLFYANDDEFQECLELLLSDETLRARLGRNGRHFVERHGARRVHERSAGQLIPHPTAL